MNFDLLPFAFLAGLTLGWLITHLAGRGARDTARQVRLQLDDVRAQSTNLREDNARLRTELAHERQSTPRQLALLEDAQTQLKASFEALAASALRSSTDEFLKLADQKLGHVQRDALGELGKRQQAFEDLVKPIRDSLTQVDGKLHDAERGRIESTAAMSALLRQVGQGQELLRGETLNLVRALRAPSVRGRWGEIQLRRVVEMAGMLPYCDFDEQPTLVAEYGRQRPDLIVKLPGGKTIVVDAKVPLEAYLDATDQQDHLIRERKLADHSRQVRDHMAKLGAKSYWAQVQPSPEFAVMFLPGEAFFHSALQHDAELIDFGVRHQVFPASPITLIALLQVVAQGWRHERLARNAEEIQALGKELYARVTKMTDYLETMRTRLDGTVKAFNDVVGSYETRVLVTARRFKELGATSGTEIEPLQSIDTAPRILQSANLLALPDEIGAASSDEPNLQREAAVSAATLRQPTLRNSE